MNDKPQITIELSPHLHDLLYHDFPHENREYVTLNMSSDIGKYITSMIETTHRIPKDVEMKNPITLILPVKEWSHYIFRNRFIYIPKWKEIMIQDFLEATWRLRVREYFTIGYDKGFSQDKIINAFLMSYNIKKNKVTYDQIKKIDYRNRTKLSKQIDKEIQLSLRFE